MAVIDERPELFDDLLDVWEGFVLLSPSRQSGMGMGYIPLAEIKAYLELFGTYDVERFVRLIRHVDREFVNEVGRRSKN